MHGKGWRVYKVFGELIRVRNDNMVGELLTENLVLRDNAAIYNVENLSEIVVKYNLGMARPYVKEERVKAVLIFYPLILVTQRGRVLLLAPRYTCMLDGEVKLDRKLRIARSRLLEYAFGISREVG